MEGEDVDLEERKKMKELEEMFQDEICQRPYAPIAMMIYLTFHPDAYRFIRCYE